MTTKELDKKYVANTYARFDLALVKGKGAYVYDEEGNEYIDLGTGIAVNTFGVNDEEWKQAVIAQLNNVQHTSNLYYSQPCALLAQTLCEKTGMKKVFFSNSGAEANETAIKVARKYGADKKGKDYFTIITLKNSFHGRTITTLSATGQDVFHENFTPMTAGFAHATANDIDELKSLIKQYKCCGIMLELVQGEGGVMPLCQDYVKQAYQLAKENDLIFIVDEVQTGNGRTGSLYAYMQYDIMPDVVTTAKGLGGGLPIGATMLNESVEAIFTPGLNGSTFGGNPIACAGAINIMQRLDETLLSEVRKKSEYIFKTLQGVKGVKSVTGLGLMIGIESTRPALEVINACQKRGVLVIKAKNKIRLLPPLNIPFETLKTAIEILKQELMK